MSNVAVEKRLSRFVLDTYEPQGVLYFHFKGKRMVAIVREQAEFDEPIGSGDSLDGYAGRRSASIIAIEASRELFDLIPRRGPGTLDLAI
jgi:hypothetical protein